MKYFFLITRHVLNDILIILKFNNLINYIIFLKFFLQNINEIGKVCKR